jgi:polysaccharide export outer membrane protein
MRNFKLFFFSITMIFVSCSSYKQNILFKTDQVKTIDQSLINLNQKIEKGDYLSLEVFTKNGEKIIDPDFELVTSQNVNSENLRPKLKYLVRNDGLVKVPMIGDILLDGLTLNEAELVLQKQYETYYNNTFVKLEFLNKRVIILGASGGKVLPLENENTTLVEIIAQAEGINNMGKGHNIRVIRNEEIFVIDLTTFDGYKQGNMIVASGDIIYIEPIRRPFTEFIKDNGPIISIFTSLVSLVAVLISIN